MAKYGIANESLVMSVLRSDLYSDPIKVIIQEYICNARDSHRDSKILSKPIEVHLPTYDEPWFSVRDYGDGITPDSFDNIFTKYCETTKKGDENSTGGFGLGAKSAWAAFKEFKVTSWTGGVKRDYLCYLKRVDDFNEIEDGFSDIVSEEKDDQQGVLIHIDVTEENWQEINFDFESISESFIKKYKFITLFWGIKPICNLSLSVEAEVVFSESNWKLYNENDGVFSGAYAVVDGVPYPIDQTIFTKYQKLLLENIVLFFKNKTLNLSPNRETLRYTEATKKKIINFLDDILEQCKDKAEESVKNCKNIWEANKVFSNVECFKPILGEIIWNDVDICKNHDDIRSFKYPGISVVQVNPIKNKHSLDVYIQEHNYPSIDFKNPIILNSTEINPSKSRLKQFFIDNPDITNVTVISAYEPHWKSLINGHKIDRWNCIDSKNLNKMSRKGEKKGSRKGGADNEIFTVVTQNNVDNLPICELEDCHYLTTIRNTVLFNNKTLYHGDIQQYLKMLKVDKVVLIPERKEIKIKKNYNLKFLGDNIRDFCHAYDDENFWYNYFILENWDYNSSFLRDVIRKEFLNLFSYDKEHPIYKVNKNSNFIEDIKNSPINFIRKFFKEFCPEKVFSLRKEHKKKALGFVEEHNKMNKLIQDKYPLLDLVRQSYSSKTYLDALKDYVVMVDNYKK